MRVTVLAVELFFLIALTQRAVAQIACEAAREFEGVTCSAAAGKCITLTIQTDPAGKKFSYEWIMGDGTTRRGVSIEHCYKEYGLYKVRLQLIAADGLIKVEEELSKDVVIAPMPGWSITEEMNVGSPVKFTAVNNWQEFSVQSFYWRFDNKEYECGPKAEYILNDSSKSVELLASGWFKGKEAKVCLRSELDVLSDNLDPLSIQARFYEYEQRTPNRGRFLDDKIHVAIINSRNQHKSKYLTLDSVGMHVSLDEKSQYVLYAWKGNLLVLPLTFQTGARDQTELDWESAWKQLLLNEVMQFEAIAFDLDSEIASNQSLNQNIELLKKFPSIHIGIGVYTHTAGRMTKNLELSNARIQYLINRLKQAGVATSRIQGYTAQQDHRLLNTCAGIENCDLENSQFNRRAEFKIMAPID